MLRNNQYTSGNQSLKGPMLGSADKCATLLLLAWPIKPVFHLQFFCTKRLFVVFSLLSDFPQSKKSRIQSYFSLSLTQKKSLHMKKFASEKPALRSCMSTRTLSILSKYARHPSFNFEAMK